MNDAVKEFLDILINGIPKKPEPFDRQGVVKRVEGRTAFVRFNGSDIETPVQMTINCAPGDTVQTRVAGKNAWLVGNLTAPPTDDRVAREAKAIARNVEKKSTEKFVTVDGLIDEQGKQIVYAIESANGKNTIYHAATEPTGGEHKVGDTWFNSDEGYAIYTWDGSDWVKEELGEDAIADLSITNAKIANGTIQDAKIGAVDVGKLTGGYIDAGHINVASLQIGITDVSGLEQALANADGNAWYTGTVMTYTDTSAHIYSNSGITDANVGDMYLNTDTNNVYRCTTGGAANVAKWVYTSTIQGDDGKGIYSISLYSTSGKTKTYRITYTDGTHYDYSVEDGTDVTSQYVTYIDAVHGVRVMSAANSSNYSQITAGAFDIYQSGNIISHQGYDSGKNSMGGTSTAPYYTFGTRASDSQASDRGNYSFAEGYRVTASGYASHAEGYKTVASGHYSHAEGMVSTTSESGSHAEGGETTASRMFAHAEGYASVASGECSHAAGDHSEAAGDNSHASGLYSYAGYDNQFVIGQYNKNKSNDAFEIGWGNATYDRRNIFEVDTSGNVMATGTIAAEHSGVTDITSQITNRGGQGTLVKAEAVTFGKVCELRLEISFTSVQATSPNWNFFTGTLPSAYRPLLKSNGSSYYGAKSVGILVDTDGTIYVRNSSNATITATAGTNLSISCTYILA